MKRDFSRSGEGVKKAVKVETGIIIKVGFFVVFWPARSHVIQTDVNGDKNITCCNLVNSQIMRHDENDRGSSITGLSIDKVKGTREIEENIRKQKSGIVFLAHIYRKFIMSEASLLHFSLVLFSSPSG